MGTIDGRGNLIDDQDDTPVRRKPLSFTMHESDDHYWEIRVHGRHGYVSLGAANGPDEADLIVRSLNVVCSEYASSNSILREAWERYMEG